MGPSQVVSFHRILRVANFWEVLTSEDHVLFDYNYNVCSSSLAVLVRNWTVSPHNPNTEPLGPNLTAVVDRAVQEQTPVKCDRNNEGWTPRPGVLPGGEASGTCTGRWHSSRLQAKERSREGNQPVDTLILNFQHPNSEKINFCCLSPQQLFYYGGHSRHTVR